MRRTGTNRGMADGRLRVATFNIRHGAPPDGRVSHGALVRTCAELDADVIALQEVDSGRLRSVFRNQAALVARRLGCAFVYGEVLRRGIFGRYGNALLTRGALRDVELVQLPRPSPRQARGAILARVALGGLDVSVAATHLQHHPAELGDQPREAAVQLRALLDTLNQRPLPRLLLGDLNLGPRRAKPLLSAAGFDCAPDVLTFPAAAPRVMLDYIAVRGLQIHDRAAVPTRASDHRAVVATVSVEPLE
jgi:endonuclease/exonuclease/phosphatase family metal-dependent hydrolase